MFSSLALALFYVLMLGILDRSLRLYRKPKNNYALRFLQALSTLYFWVFLIPIIDFYASIIECDSNGNLKQDSSVKCFSVLHAFYCALFAFGFILQNVITVTISLLFNESRPNHTDAFSRLDTNLEVYLTLYRVKLMAFSHHTADYPSYQWLSLAVNTFTCIHLLRSYNHFLPYYQKYVSITYGACCLAFVWLVANVVLLKALTNFTYQGQIIVICIGFVLMWPTA